MEYLCLILIGYLSGSILYAYLLPKYVCHVDITKNSQDKNPGAANAFMYAGVPTGLAVILLELSKGFFPVFAASQILDTDNLLFGLVIAAPAAGHAFPLFKPDRGGKAIAVSFGALLGLYPQMLPVMCLAFFYLLFSLLIKVSPHFYRSIITFGCFFSSCLTTVDNKAILIGNFCICFIVIYKHIKRYQGEKLQIDILLLSKVKKKQK